MTGSQLLVIMGFVPFINPNHLLGHDVTRGVDLRVFEISPDSWIYVMVSLTLTILGEQRSYNTKTSECWICKVLWVVNIRILQDPSHPFDHGGACIT
jgi:hypothetical protein